MPMYRVWGGLLAMLACVCGVALPHVARAQEISPSAYQDMRWRLIGPFRGGRTRAATGVPSQPNVFYIGQVNGGVWKSDDYGRTWTPIFDSQSTQSIGAIAVAPSDPNIIYVASGEGLQRPDLSVGDGIYKSTDAGKTWMHLGLRDGEQIPALAIDPRDPNRVFAAVLGHPYGPNEERGIFRTTDGGVTWEKILYRNENTGGSDIEMDPKNPDVLYAALWEARQGPWEYGNGYSGTDGGLFKSTDGGATWRQLTNGLPKDLVQIYVAIAPSEPNRLYATVGTTNLGAYESGAGLGVYRSDDAGEHWTQITTDPRPAMRIGGGDLPIPRVDPKNADVVYSASIVTHRSTDGGKTWTPLRGAPGGDDYQNLWINPENPDVILLVSDQGAIVSVNRGQTWSSWYNQPTAQIYHVSVTNEFPYRVCGGQQESGSVCIASRGNDGEITFRDWHPVGAIEYGYVAPDPLDPGIIFGAGTDEVSKYYVSTGQVQNVTPIPIRGQFRVDRTQPLMFSPVDPHILYYTANFVFKTTDAGENWQIISPDLARPHPGIPASLGNMAAKDPKADTQRGVVYALAPSFKNADTLWAGTDDGMIWLTRDAGKNWKDITPPELAAWSKVTQLAASRFDEETAYASVSRFRIDDLHPFIYRTHDAGKTWKLIVAGLPDNSPVDTIREDPLRKGLLFAGTETSVWISFDDGDHWQSLQLNLPHTSMRDLLIHDNDLIVATHGRSFWILDDISPLRQIDAAVLKADAHLFNPALAYRVRRDTNTDTPLPPDEPAGQNPPDKVVLDYYFATPARGEVAVEILDSKNLIVRRFSTTDKPEVTEEDLEKQLIPLYWLRPERKLQTGAGMHRWLWDLRYPPPDSAHHGYPIAAVPGDTPRVPLGPSVLPGDYTVRLSANGATYTAPLTVKMDPRVKATMIDLAQQLQTQSELADLLSRSSAALLQARSLSKELDDRSERAAGALKNAIADLQKKLIAAIGDPAAQSANGMKNPTLTSVNGQVGTLYDQLDRADAAPTPAQSKATANLSAAFGSAIGGWDDIVESDLPALNKELLGANLQQIRIEAHPQREEVPQGDEE
jgi:photosystem II stability/assembly factor-like uncharacterized protein